MVSCSLRAPLQRRSIPTFYRCPRGSRPLVCAASSGFKARWSLDVKFGSKLDAVALLTEWVSTVGAAAGLTPCNTTLNTGSIGAPESTLELEVNFSSLAELEEFWSSIPQQEHKAWGQRMQQYIVHGSPQWQVYRCLPAFPETIAAAAAPTAMINNGKPSSSFGGNRATSSSGRASSGSLLLPSEEEVAQCTVQAAALPSTQQQTSSGLSVVSGDEEAQTVLDWKGESMKVNPGDKLPFKFL